MTFKMTDRYAGRVTNDPENYPRGKFKNRSTSVSEDGTYLEEDWKNDERAFFEAIYKNANVVANGRIDTANDCQIYDALMGMIQKMISVGAEHIYGQANGSSDTITTTLNRDIELKNGVIIYVRAQYRNNTTSPTLKVNQHDARAIVKGNNLPLSVGDINGAGYVMQLTYDYNFNRWILMNPATGVIVPESIPVGTIAYMGRNDNINGWLKIDNREHQRSHYPRLVAECPQFIQAGSNPSTFKLIDLRGYFLRTLDNGKGVDTGRGFGSQQGDAIRNIKGGFGFWDGTINPDEHLFYREPVGESKRGKSGSWVGQDRIGFDASRVVPTASENRPKNYALPLYIKY